MVPDTNTGGRFVNGKSAIISLAAALATVAGATWALWSMMWREVNRRD